MTARILVLAFAALILGGCGPVQSYLGSKPMQFFCPNLGPYIEDYRHRSFAQLQQYAVPPTDDDAMVAAPASQFSAFELQAEQMAFGGDRQPKALLLSGGGQWGAFGAGFLAAQQPANRDWDVVTGISTGAIQALFVGADEFEKMAALYRLPNGNPASANGFRLLTRGSQHDLSPLREMLREQLYYSEGVRLLETIASGTANGKVLPEVWIGLAEGRSTNLRTVHLSGYVRDHFGAGDPASEKAVGDCVAGLVLGSSAIPLRLTPVQIDISDSASPTGEYRTFMDGGIRLSIIDEQMAELLDTTYALDLCAQLSPDTQCTRFKVEEGLEKGQIQPGASPGLYIVRNGPTIVPTGGTLETEIDRDPDAYVTAIRGYSILVNQNELASVSEMQARHPSANIFFASADGYNWMNSDTNPRPPCPERNEKIYFHKEFMECLETFGRWRKSNIDAASEGWFVLQSADKIGLDGEPASLPSADAFLRAAPLLQRRRAR